jgi:hypothetical protein
MLRNTRCDIRAHLAGRLGIRTVPLLVLLCLILSACLDDPGAPPPGAFTSQPTATPDPMTASEHTGEFGGLGDFEFSTDPLPAAEQIYFSFGTDIWRLNTNGDPEPVVRDLQIAGFSTSARGDYIAVMHLDRDDDDDETIDVSVFDEDGGAVFTLDAVASEYDVRAIGDIEAVAISPSGASLALTFQNGAMSLVTLDGEVRQLLQPSNDMRPGRLAWSSDGQFLTYLDPWMPNQPSGLFVLVPARDLREPLADAGEDQQGILRARWVPGTPYVVFVKSSGSTIAHGGDMFMVNAETGRQELLMSAGEIAPVSGVVDIAPSHDGEWLASTGFVPGDDHPAFAGLWLTNLQSGLRTEIDLDSDALVTDLWWLGDRLVVRSIDEPQTSLPGTYTGRESFQLLEIDPESGAVNELFADSDGEP